VVSFERLILDDGIPGPRDARRQALKVFDDQGRVCLPSRAEIRLDTEMNLYGAVLEPAAAAFREIGRFRNLGYAEKPLIEGASLILPPGGMASCT
jgi:hypothetical protein